VPGFVVAHMVGGAVAVGLPAMLYPEVSGTVGEVMVAHATTLSGSQTQFGLCGLRVFVDQATEDRTPLDLHGGAICVWSERVGGCWSSALCGRWPL
jgi:hypothetical protein